MTPEVCLRHKPHREGCISGKENCGRSSEPRKPSNSEWLKKRNVREGGDLGLTLGWTPGSAAPGPKHS